MSTADSIIPGLREALPIELAAYTAPAATGLVLIDLVNGFCTPGAGNLAPPVPDPQIDRMVEVCAGLARLFRSRDLPVLAFLDTHEPGRPEPPYPLHCERGTGEEDFVPALEWLSADPDVTIIRKPCINAFVGAMEPTFLKGLHGASQNRCIDWINAHRLEALITVGICTDICVMDFVVTLLSVRNRGFVPTLRDVVVLEPGCATYDLPREVAERLGLPVTAAHPGPVAHHLGLYAMASRGAVLAGELARL